MSGAGLAAAVVAACVSWLVSRRLARRPLAALIDTPNERSLHETPTPRSGGLAIVSGLAAGAVVLVTTGSMPPGAGWTAAAAACVIAVSFADDLSHVNKGVRLLVHLAASVLLVAGGAVLDRITLPGIAMPLSDVAGWALSAFVVVWLVNVYNFMDGMDGFAGGMAVSGFTTFALLGAVGGDASFVAWSLCVAGAAAGFLSVNFPPARIFMGDLGSSLLGFLAAALALLGEARGLFPLWIGVLVFSPFAVDASVTLVARIVRGEPFWRSHKSHYYQRLVELGWGHRRTVLAGYVLMALSAVSALAALGAAARWQWTLLVAWTAGYAMIALGIGRLERRGGNDGRHEAP